MRNCVISMTDLLQSLGWKSIEWYMFQQKLDTHIVLAFMEIEVEEKGESTYGAGSYSGRGDK